MSYPILPSKLVLMSTKSYFSPSKTKTYLQQLLNPSYGIVPVKEKDVLFGLIPDFLSIYPCAEELRSWQQSHHNESSLHPEGWPLHLGAQDCFWSAEYGAFTGEVVPPALKELGVTIVELGHAERRRLLSETDETAAKKAAATSANGMIPLVCIGELDAPDLNGPMSAAVGKAMRELTPQITSLLAAVPKDAPVIFAYEPVWAIGADKPAGVEYVGPVVEAIRNTISSFSKDSGRTGQTKVVYGGSAGPGLWSGQINGGNPLGKYVDGMFLGRFAHKIEGVKKVVDEVVDNLKNWQD